MFDHTLGARPCKPLFIMLLAAACAGCTSTTPLLDKEFGQTVRLLREQQTIDPNASGNADATALDANAASGVMDRYRASYQRPAPQTNIFTIGVGR